ncbi:MAG: hypothetical protein JWN04_6420 [Myxococcaceae bacterium]|nr:hypothetical protein [Myxococcaceae bacterium]
MVVSDFLDVELSVGPQRVVVNAEPNVLSLITTRLDGQILHVEVVENTGVSNSRATVHIASPSLSLVTSEDSTTVHGELNAPTPTIKSADSATVKLTLQGSVAVTADASGSSVITLSGSGTTVHAIASDSAGIDSELPTSSASIDTSDSSTVEVTATSDVHVGAGDSAEALVHGNPSVRDVKNEDAAGVAYLD